MKKIYIARQIPKMASPAFILNITKDMTLIEIRKAYVDKIQIFDSYIYNGPWILRPPITDNTFEDNNLPLYLRPEHVWQMVKEKIHTSDVFIGIVNSKSYGTIAEAGYACQCNDIAVYIIPELGLNEEEIQDLWFIFQIAKNTKPRWDDNDFKTIPEFKNFGINSVHEYESYVDKIIPNFMKK